MEQPGRIPLRIHYCGYEECEPGHFFGPAVRAHYLMHFIISGRGCYQAGGKTCKLTAGQAFLIRPQEITYYEADKEEPWTYIWTAFEGEEAERLLWQYGLGEGEYICSYSEAGQVKENLLRISETFSKSNYSQEELMGYFYLIFSGILVKNNQQKQDYDRDYFRRAKQYIRNNYGYPIRVSDIARHVGIDRTYLYKIFQNHAGRSPKQYLTAYRIKAAKDMLASTGMNVTEVGMSCGFSDSSVFCKNFDRLEGISPLRYRKKIKSGSPF